MNIISYRDGARDFSNSGIKSLNTYGVGDVGQEAENAYQWNEIEDDINKNLQEYEDYEYEDAPTKKSTSSKFSDMIKSGMSSGSTIGTALGLAATAFAVDLATTPEYTGKNGKKSSFTSLLIDINTRDALSINIEARKKELMDTEGKWLPQIQLAQQYLLDKLKLLELLKAERGSMQVTLNGGSYMEQYAQLWDKVLQLEKELREVAKTNPYLTDVFFGDVVDLANKPPTAGVRAVSSLTPNLLIDGEGNISGSNIRRLISEGKLPSYWEDLSWKLNNSELDKGVDVAKSLLDIKYEKIQEKLLDALGLFDKKSDELLRKQHSLKTAHMLHDPLLGIIPLDIVYDPDNIDPVLDAERSNTEISITDPSSWKYGMLHFGSSYSEILAMAALVIISGIVKYGSKAAGAYTGPAAPLVWATGEAAVGLMSTAYFRHKETAAEVMSNYSEKIATLAAEGKFNVNTVLDDYSRLLKTMGYDTDSMDDLEVLQFGLAYNLKTKEPNYQQFANNARKGLTKLEEVNNALSLSDYALNFGLSYGGKLVRESFGLKNVFKGAANLANKNKATAKVLKTLTGKIDRSIDKVLSSPVKKMAAGRVLQNGANIAGRLGKNWLAERTEEGIQGIAGREYKDSPLWYNEKPTDEYNIFRGILKSADLAVEANLAYHGLHWNDLYNTDEQLKREMEIGGFIGTFMGGVSNVGNVNRLRKQLRSDRHIMGLAAEGFDKAETSYKAAQFLDSYRKGNNSKYLQDTLESFKKYKSEGVTDQMIDEDIELARTVYGLYKNKAIKQNLSDLNIDRKKDKSFEIFVQNAVDVKRRFDDSIEASDKSDELVKRLMDAWMQTSENESESNPFKEFIDKEYKRYKKQVGDNKAVSEELFRAPIINAMRTKITNRVLKQLKKDLKSRKKTLQELKKEYGINTNTTGIEGILKYIEDSQKSTLDLLDKYDESMFKGTLDKVVEPAMVEELERMLAISIINQGVAHSLSARTKAYFGGRVEVKDRYLIEQKPLFSTLSEESKEKVLAEYSQKYKEKKGTDKEPTVKLVVSFYNRIINDQWAALENSANVETNERFLANALIQLDLAKGFEELDQARAELNEETGMEAANNDQEVVEETTVEETTEAPAEVKPEVTENTEPDTNKGKDKRDTAQEKTVTPDSVSEDNDRTSTATPIDGVSTETVDEAATEDSDNNEGDSVTDIDTILDEVAENGFVDEESDTPFNEASTEEAMDNLELAAIHDRIIEDDDVATLEAKDALESKLDALEDGEPLAVVDDLESAEEPAQDPSDMEDDKALTSQEPTVEDQKPAEEKPKEEVVKPKTTKLEKSTTKVTVESYDGASDEVVLVEIDDPSTLIYSDGEQVWVGNEDPGLAVEIPGEELAMLDMFELVDAVDMGTTEEAAAYLGLTDKSPGLDTKKKVESNRIHSTFFFLPTGTEPMQITVNGKPMEFDGERKSGSELADRLAVPGWLSKQRVYYVVTDSQLTRKLERDAADRLAVHMIIEEEVDGKKYIYNASLYEPEKARAKVRKWGVPKDKQDSEVRKLRELRKKIIDKYITTYAPGYFSDPKVMLPQTAPKGITPVGVRQSNGSINSQATPDKRPIYRSLTTVEEFGLSSDPVEMSKLIIDGEVEFGYGKGPFPMDPADRFTIVHFDEVTPATAQGVGYAGKIYIIPKVSNTPSQKHSAPIMLAEKRHFIPGGSKTLVTSYTPKGVAKSDDLGKRIPLSSAELVFRLLTRTLPNSGQPVYQDILHILCNHGPSTVTLGDNRVEKLSFYVRKTLHAYSNNKGEDFLMYAARTPEGQYTLKYLKIRDAQGNVVFTDQQAYDVIRLISNNIHWNTDKVSMMEPISDNIVEEAIRYMEKFNTDYYRVLNCEDLVFTMEDLNLERVDGKVVRKSGDTPILMSWMINHQVLKTDVGDRAFRAPFIYADDAAVAETALVSTEATVTTVGQLMTDKTKPRISRDEIKKLYLHGGRRGYVESVLSTETETSGNPFAEGKTIKDFDKALDYVAMVLEHLINKGYSTWEAIDRVSASSLYQLLAMMGPADMLAANQALSRLLGESVTQALKGLTKPSTPQDKVKLMASRGKTITTADLFGRTTGPTGISELASEAAFGKKIGELKVTLDTGITFNKISYERGYKVELRTPNTKDYVVLYYDNEGELVGEPFINIGVGSKQFLDYIDDDMSIKDEDIFKIIRENFDLASNQLVVAQDKGVTEDRALSYDETVAMGLTPKQGFTHVLKADGTTVMLPNSSAVLKKLIGKDRKGVYSTVRGQGAIDIDSAKLWLHDKLGIDKDDILVTNAVINMSDAKGVFGLVKSSFNRILNEFTPTIALSILAGRGLEYHEAWHYVSLMVLNEAQRNQVYSDFIKRNPQYKDYTKTDVEEVLAEEFRAYMLKETNPSWGYRVLKFFKAVWKLANIFGRRDINLQSEMFEAIRKGKFRNAEITQDTLEKYAQEHPFGVGYYAPGISDEEQAKVPHITNASTMYNIIESLSSTALSILNIRSMEDIRNLSLSSVFDTIQYMYDSGEYDSKPASKLIVEDVLLNKAMFAKQIKLFLQELGVRSIEQELTRIAEEEAKLNGDSYDNIWDRASYEISKKANTAFNAKLFFYSIPQSRFVLDENGVQQLDSVKDSIFGLDMVQPFDVTWNKVLDNLWLSNDWPDLISKVRNLSNADPFFARLLERIADPNYPLPENTVTELLTTIQSAKNSMDTIDIQPDAAALTINNAMGRKIWTVADSDNLRKIARLPSNWSQNFMVSTMVTVDERNRSIINTKLFQKLKKLDAGILNGINQINKSKDSVKNALTFQLMKQDFLELVNMIGIPFDNESLVYLLNKIRPKNTNSMPGFEAFVTLYTAKDKKQSKNSNRMVGSISNSVISNILKMKDGKSLEVTFKKLTISGSRIFNYKNPNAAINLMAIAYGETHPTPEEFSVTGADGSLLYPITQNNYMSDQLRWLNTNAYDKLSNLAKAEYSKNSLIVKALSSPDKPKLKLHTLIAINESETGSSRDYFGISPLEDYITKMVLAEQGRIILPTMSDKKTWYSIEGISIPKDFLASYKSEPDATGVYLLYKIGKRFSNDTLEIFYNYFLDEYNSIVKYYNTKSDVEKSKSRYYDNYHGKIGKDGKMKPGGNGGKFRYFNQLPVKGVMTSLNLLLTDAEESGDPVLLNTTLDNIKRLFVDDKAQMYDILNTLLLDKVDKEVEQAIKLGVIKRKKNGHLTYGNLPSPNKPENADGSENPNVFERYKEMGKDILDKEVRDDDIIYSMIANYMTAYAISIEEIEKCFVGDPAMYKWKSNSDVGIFQRDVDKIKRLSSVLSTGTNLRTYWGENDPRNTTKFVSAIMADNMIGSEYHSQLELIFKASFARVMLQKNNPEYTDNELFELTNEENLSNTLADRSIITEDDLLFINKLSKKAANPYAYDDENNSGNINQADAAVYIRPAFYRKIMLSLGQWSEEIEEAYNILESDGIVDPDTGKTRTPLNDPELYRKALAASIKPLKMMYFGDHFDNVSGINVPIFDKMAMFPMFKILANADNKHLYDRMNNEELGVIDMLKFESSTKVGSTKDKFKPYKDNRNNQFNIEDLNKPSSTIISRDDSVLERLGDGLTTRVQDLKLLRLQLNTEPHEAIDRSFGTLAIKIGMGNVVDTRIYGLNKGLSITGSLIKNDIFGCIKALSDKGRRRVESRFFDKNGRIKYKALSDYLVKEAQGTNMSMEIVEALKLNKQGRLISPIASLSVRNWIESKIVSLINKEVIDVNTPGGSAILMASFGFKKSNVGIQTDEGTIRQSELLDTNLKELGLSIRTSRFLTNNNIRTIRDIIEYGQTKLQKYGGKLIYQELTKLLDGLNLDFNVDTSLSTELLGTYAAYNNGKKLSFEPSKGSMEVMLSTNFFRHVIPAEFQTDYNTMRNWLIDHGIIGNSSKPYGVGYRIPTQGLSSTFSFIVADVLPEHTGDTIIVPDEFTAMTGSDFDIDKLYIATYSYDSETNERYQWDDTKDYYEQSEGALINKLLDSYTLVISDEKTLSETRASIDTLTGILKAEILPKVQTTLLTEAEPMYELMPSFLGSRKTEYTSGKAGIAPFALNSTNHCLTLATHITMNYSKLASKYGLGDLDAIDGQDSYKILDWLSAMINAHVDVAKDPYIITLNVNSVTYNMTNLLLRAGKGKLTFFFLAQPAIKEFANLKIMNNGVVGVRKLFDNTIIKQVRQKYLDMLEPYLATMSKAYKELIKDYMKNGSIKAFTESDLSNSLEAFKNEDPSVQDIVMLLICLKAYEDLMSDALTLADLVHRSLIDTKKYGNNVALLHNFSNSYYTFLQDNSSKFRYTVEDPELPNKGYDNALLMYFNETFLLVKLDYATDLTDRILKSQILSATNGYKTLFTQVMSEIQGGDYIPMRDGLTISYLYKPVTDKTLIKKINDRVESVVRARIATNNTNIRIEDSEIRELLFGNDNIAKRLNSIKNYIRLNKDDIALLTLVDDQGNIKNDLLNYLQAVTVNKKNLLNRISTSTSAMDNSRHFEDRLISAFYDLLTNDDPSINEFAELLVKYAFLTSYDTRTPNSFFQLVPMKYKLDMGYVGAISESLSELNRNEMGSIGGSTDINNLGKSIYLTLARNYWKDNDIVPTYTRAVKVNEEGGSSWSNTLDLASTKDKSYSNVNTVIAARDYYDIAKNNKFIKIVGSRGNNTVLYERVGQIVDMESGKTTELVYVAIPKLGFDSGASSVYELYKEGNEESAFESNLFTETMIQQTTTDLPEIIKKYTSRYKNRLLEFIKDPEYQSVEIAQYHSTKENIAEEGVVDPTSTVEEPLADTTDELGSVELAPSDFLQPVTEESVLDELGTVDDEVIDFLDNMEDDSSLLDDLDTILDLNPEEVIGDILSSTEEFGFETEAETEISDVESIASTVKKIAEKGRQRKIDCK